MLARFRPRLTYANVISTLCLFMLLGGGAYAASSLIGNDGKIHGCVDKKGHLTLVKAGAKCGKGKSRIAWNQKGAPGQNGAAGSARAFAHVRGDGTLDTANSKNVIDVSPECTGVCASAPPKAAHGIQCFKLGFTPKSAVVSADFGTAPVSTVGEVLIPGRPTPTVDFIGGCAPGYTSAEVFTFDTTTGNLASAGFYVVFN